MKPAAETVLEELALLGVQRGDILFVTADLMRVGFFLKNRNETLTSWVRLLSQAVGENGTIVAAAYTPVFFRLKKKESVVFTRAAPTTAGALSAALLSDPRSMRSNHPTNSCVAIGRYAEEILQGHDQNSLCYSVLGKIVQRGGKHLMLGTIDNKNAPLGLHYAQERLGITRAEPTVGLFQTYYIDTSGQKKIFTKWDTGGCSRGGYKMFGKLLIENALKIGRVGNTQAALIDAEKSALIALAALNNDRRAFICDDKSCISCRGRWSVSGLATPFIYIGNLAARYFPKED
jgi:aminoglycoside 3-N-acetyltransferase